jgi:hypothetical protein
MLERHIAFYRDAPRPAAADGGFATRLNLRLGIDCFFMLDRGYGICSMSIVRAVAGTFCGAPPGLFPV